MSAVPLIPTITLVPEVVTFDKTPVPKVADNKESPQVVPVAFKIAFPVLQIYAPVVGS